MRGNETPGQIVTNFCTGVRVHDVITSANFYDCSLWGLSVVGGQILGFSIDSRRRPYNTLALPCECVISTTTTTTVTNTLAVDEWDITNGTARRELAGLRPRPVRSSLYQM